MLIPRWDTFMAGADNHGDEQDEEAVAKFLKHAGQFKPKRRIHLGDGFNLTALRKKATEDEKRHSIRQDIHDGKDFIERFKPTDFMLGNHDFRLWDNAENAQGIVHDLCDKGVEEIEKLCKHVGAKIYPYHVTDGVLSIGKLNFLHGFYVGVNAARRHALEFDACLFGHTHTISEAPVPGMKERVARSIGCLCKLSQPYNSRTPSSRQHRHGWAYGAINKVTGDYFVIQARKIGGEWIIPSDIQSL